MMNRIKVIAVIFTSIFFANQLVVQVSGMPIGITKKETKQTFERVEKKIQTMENRLRVIDAKIRITIDGYKKKARKKFEEIRLAYQNVLAKLSTLSSSARARLSDRVDSSNRSVRNQKYQKFQKFQNQK